MMICGRKRLMIVTTSLRIESRGQKRNVSSAVLEKPKSYARVKNCLAPSSSRREQLLGTDDAGARGELGTDQVLAALTAAERQIGDPRPIPRASSTSSCVSSSSGCAPIIRTRLLLPSCRSVPANAATPPVRRRGAAEKLAPRRSMQGRAEKRAISHY
jgi:hypothetical protein